MINISMASDINALIKAFNDDREETLRQIYSTYRDSFINFSKKYSSDEELMIDCFQEAVISLYENLTIGKITSKESTVKTYLYAIGKHKILNSKKKNFNQNKLVLHQADVDESLSNKEDIAFNKSLLEKGFDALGKRCKEVLIRYYYHGYSIEAIMNDMQYKNENTVKAHKSRCIAQLRKIIPNIKSI